jgi:hypothetical protein
MSMGANLPGAAGTPSARKRIQPPPAHGLEAMHGLTLVVNEAARDPSSPPKRHATGLVEIGTRGSGLVAALRRV